MVHIHQPLLSYLLSIYNKFSLDTIYSTNKIKLKLRLRTSQCVLVPHTSAHSDDEVMNTISTHQSWRTERKLLANRYLPYLRDLYCMSLKHNILFYNKWTKLKFQIHDWKNYSSRRVKTVAATAWVSRVSCLVFTYSSRSVSVW